MHNSSKNLIMMIFFIIISNFAFTQSNVIVFGTVQDIDSEELIQVVTVYQKGTGNAVETSPQGVYHIELPSNEAHTIVFTRIGFQETEIKVPAMAAGVKRNINVKMILLDDNLNIVIRESKFEDLGMVREEVTEMKLLPSTTGNLESVLPQIALGTTGGTGGELSSQYNVRGGNYDENLIYVNDFEIFKPQLISNSQQEGLSFPNMDLIRDLSFSSGGFESKYGDKLSSVLDVKYKRPDELKMSASMSLLGGTIHAEGSNRIGANAYNKLRYLVGARYKTTKLLLNSGNIQGEYQPNFFDVQSYLTYDFTRSLQLSWLNNYNSSVFNFEPRERNTAFGGYPTSLEFSAVYEGQEKDYFKTLMNGIGLTYLPEREKNPYFLKLLASNNIGVEVEGIDIEGAYRLSQIEVGFGENAGEEVAVLGTGTQHRYVRNRLNNNIWNIEHKGGIEFENVENKISKSNFIEWGAKYQNRTFDDNINEWERLDSSGFSLPTNPDKLLLFSSLKSKNNISTNEYSAFIQNTYSYTNPEKRSLKINLGVRGSYLDMNKDFLISPRVQILYQPIEYNEDISFKLAGGLYYQQPFYREMRRLDGTLNTDLKAQRSIHLVGGLTYNFHWTGLSDKPFKLISEVYYKKLDNLVSYDVDNVRIRYSGENDSKGYVTGLDMRLNGELVKGIESWVNLSFLRARESIYGVQHLERRWENGVPIDPEEVSSVPRPSDQLVNLALFFQDYLPKNENFKVHVAFNFGSGLKYHKSTDDIAYRNSNEFKAYHRIDIGFSYHLWNHKRIDNRPKHLFRFSKDAWINLEIFNLMNISNVASYTWIRTVNYLEYSIPNNLTGRRINLKLKIDL